MAQGSGALGGLLLCLLVDQRSLDVFCVKGNCITLLHRVHVYYGYVCVCVGGGAVGNRQ